MELIPAIDLIDGKCVRLTQGDYTQKNIYREDPLEVALEFEDLGIKRLHLVDLDGAKAGQVQQWKVLERLCTKTNLQIDFGGGIKTDNDMEAVLASGAFMATIGTIAVKDQQQVEEWIKVYGTDRLYLGADSKDNYIVTQGWFEQSKLETIPFIENWTKLGLTNIFCTDVRKDGMMQGPSFDLYKDIISQCNLVKLTASGGIRDLADLELLKSIGLHGAIIGKALYEGGITVVELKKYIQNEG